LLLKERKKHLKAKPDRIIVCVKYKMCLSLFLLLQQHKMYKITRHIIARSGMTLLIMPLFGAIARLERELGRLWRDGRIGPGPASQARCAVLGAYIDLHELCVELLRRYLAEAVLTPDAVDRAFYSELMEAAAAAGLL
jgi:hypothetical protein